MPHRLTPSAKGAARATLRAKNCLTPCSVLRGTRSRRSPLYAGAPYKKNPTALYPWAATGGFGEGI